MGIRNLGTLRGVASATVKTNLRAYHAFARKVASPNCNVLQELKQNVEKGNQLRYYLEGSKFRYVSLDMSVYLQSHISTSWE
jgi:hypothetical protein